MPNITCSQCGTQFFRYPSQVRQTVSGLQFCSKACHQRGQYVHGLNVSGYKIVRVGGKQVYEHRWVIEQSLGRKLLSTEHVHHVNGDKADNRIQNLQVLQESTHHREHAPLLYDIELAKRLYDIGLGYKKLGQLFGRAPSVVREAFVRRGWHDPTKTKPPTRATRAAVSAILGDFQYGIE